MQTLDKRITLGQGFRDSTEITNCVYYKWGHRFHGVQLFSGYHIWHLPQHRLYVMQIPFSGSWASYATKVSSEDILRVLQISLPDYKGIILYKFIFKNTSYEFHICMIFTIFPALQDAFLSWKSPLKSPCIFNIGRRLRRSMLKNTLLIISASYHL